MVTTPTTYSALKALAVLIATEDAEGANTAERVGAFMEGIVYLSTMPFDPAATYQPGQYVFFSDTSYRCKIATSVGESPSNTPSKWQLKEGLSALLDQLPYATETTPGKVRQATNAEFSAGTNNNAYVTAFQIKTFGNLTKTLKQLADTSALADLKYVFKKLLGVESINLLGSIAGNANVFFKRFLPDFQGLTWLNGDKDTSSVAGYFGFTGSNANDNVGSIGVGGQEVLNFVRDELRVMVAKLNAPETQGRFRRLTTTGNPLATNPDKVLVTELNPDTGDYDYKVYSFSALAAKIYENINRAEWAEGLSPFITGEEIEGDLSYPAGPYLCADFETSSTAATTEQFIVITQSMLGSPQPHGLSTVGTNIWRELQSVNVDDADDRNDALSYIKISFPSTSTYLLTPTDPTLSDFNGELYLKKKTTA